MTPVTCPKCEAPLTYQPPVKRIAAPWFFAELSAWLIAGLFVAAFSAAGLSNYWVAGVLGAVAGLALFVKLANDTESDPGEGLYFCDSCKRYFKPSSVIAADGGRSAI